MTSDDLFAQGLQRHRQGHLAEAEAIYREILAREPNHFRSLQHLGAILFDRGQAGESAELFGAAASIAPSDPVIHYQLAGALAETGRYQESLAAYDAAIALNADIALLHAGRGCILHALNRLAEAVEAYDRALALRPNDPLSHANRAAALQAAGRSREALGAIDRALALAPSDPKSHLTRGVILLELGEPAAAAPSLERVASAMPDNLEAQLRLGHAKALTASYAAAIAAFSRVLARDPDNTEALAARGGAFTGAGRSAEAEADLADALARDPELAVAYLHRAQLGRATGRLAEAAADDDHALALAPVLTDPVGARFLSAAMACDWPRRAEAQAELIAAARAGDPVYPCLLLYAADDPALHRAAAVRWAGPTKAPLRPSHAHQRLRIAYLSPDFREHPVAWQAVELFEHHDHARFEIFALSLSADDNSPIRRRLTAAFDHLIETGAASDPAIARLIAEHEIDIAVDLAGYTTKGRGKALAYRPAAVAVNWLGYPGTLGAPYIDYIFADDVVVPPAAEGDYSEKIVRLPQSYMPRDTTIAAGPVPLRSAAGLPETGFVFGAFHNAYKIDPLIFALWLRLLVAVPGSVLWLNLTDAAARQALRRAAAAGGVAPDRLVFAPRVETRAAHLSRLKLVDLFLDTPAYNGHATVSDMLWAGVPVVATMGSSFATRVSAGMLKAAGLDALVAADLDGYERLALELAAAPAQLLAFKAHLAEPGGLFDTKGLCRAVETAFEIMAERHRRGQNPASFSVTLSPGSGPQAH
jgi:predicted O-linked N-acetylglucosamine transferase (SPINDLY family)